MFRPRLARVAALAAIAVTAPLLAACGGDGAADDGKIRFGVINSMTGGYGAVGKEEIASIKLAIAEINAAGGVNGSQLDVVVVDDQGSVAEATAGFKRLAVQEKLPVIFGPGITATSEAVAPLADRNGVTLINFASQPEITEGHKGVFQLLGPQRSVAHAMVNHAADKGLTRAAILHINDPFGTNGSKYINEKAKERGISIAFEDSWNADAFNFSAQASKLMSANPPLLFMYGSGGTSNGQILKAIRDAGYKGVILGDLTFATGGLSSSAGPAAETIVSFSQINYANPDEVTARYLSAIQKELGKPAASFAATGYDAVYLLKAAIEKAGRYEAEAVRKALENNLGFSGVLGKQEYTPEYHAGPGASVFVPVQLSGDKFVSPTS
ncbi:ABC transporter substrate-binding protein [Micromonospora sonneratiae]|uniref:ABC transporter substrate-binding protein n=1 Tax=Micromonospora sonneratiae TaxID=1184706 RepID=A0ABW3Y5M2_9ACTN